MITRDDVLRLFDVGDLQGLLLAVGREWVEEYYPHAEYAVLVVGHGDGIPATRITLDLAA